MAVEVRRGRERYEQGNLMLDCGVSTRSRRRAGVRRRAAACSTGLALDEGENGATAALTLLLVMAKRDRPARRTRTFSILPSSTKTPG
jgi:methenyltetrahydromethanopterin cyclohydrolase